MEAWIWKANDVGLAGWRLLWARWRWRSRCSGAGLARRSGQQAGRARARNSRTPSRRLAGARTPSRARGSRMPSRKLARAQDDRVARPALLARRDVAAGGQVMVALGW